MQRFRILLCAVLAFSQVSRSQEKPLADPIAAELKKAQDEYAAATEKAKKALVAAFATQQTRVENSKLKVAEVIKLVEQIQEEKKAFEEDSTRLPASVAMRGAVIDYRSAVFAAGRKCEAAFDKAAEAYRQKKDLASAKAVLAAKAEFATSLPGDRRTKWVYNDGKLWFQAGRDGEWTELARADGATNKYKEVARTGEFVELEKASEATTHIRLYESHSEVKYQREAWKALYRGNWADGK